MQTNDARSCASCHRDGIARCQSEVAADEDGIRLLVPSKSFARILLRHTFFLLSRWVACLIQSSKPSLTWPECSRVSASVSTHLLVSRMHLHMHHVQQLACSAVKCKHKRLELDCESCRAPIGAIERPSVFLSPNITALVHHLDRKDVTQQLSFYLQRHRRLSESI